MDMTVTDLAKKKLSEYLQEEPDDTIVRILVEDDGKYGLSLDQMEDGDFAFEVTGIRMVVEPAFVATIEGLKIDYLDQGASSGFSLTGGKAIPKPPKGAKAALVRCEETPNPDARKFVLSFSQGGEKRTWAPGAKAPAGVREILELEGVATVFQRRQFLTVTRSAGADWDKLMEGVILLLERLERPSKKKNEDKAPEATTLDARLERFLEAEVVPFLERDGGTIELVELEDSTARVRLVGACSTCPSSAQTLKLGVERRVLTAFADEVRVVELV